MLELERQVSRPYHMTSLSWTRPQIISTNQHQHQRHQSHFQIYHLRFNRQNKYPNTNHLNTNITNQKKLFTLQNQTHAHNTYIYLSIYIYIYTQKFFFLSLFHFVKYYSPLCYCILCLQLHTLCCYCCCCSSSMAVGVCFLLVCIITVFSSLRLGSCSLCPKDSNLFLYALHSQCPISISPNPPLQVRFLFFFLFNFTFP